MKKLILFFAVTILVIGVKAQTTFGIQAGANFASIKSDDAGTKITSDTKVGFIVGVLANVGFGNQISFRPELNFIQKGGTQNETSTSNGITSKDEIDLVLGYVQLSPNFVYNFSSGSGGVFLGVGPELSFGLGGKAKFTSTVTGGGLNESESGKYDVKFDGKKDATDNNLHLKSFDYGANILAGYKLENGAFISAGYTLGLANISPENNSSFKNRGFHVKIGYAFGGSVKSKK